MATLNEIAALRTSATLLTRFMVAVEKVASTILAEPVDTASHADRLAWAKRCMFDKDNSQRYADVIRKVALHLDANFPTTGEAITDAAIVAIVNSYVATLAAQQL